MHKQILTVIILLITVTINSQEKERESRFDEISERLNVSFESNAQWYLNDKKFEDMAGWKSYYHRP